MIPETVDLLVRACLAACKDLEDWVLAKNIVTARFVSGSVGPECDTLDETFGNKPLAELDWTILIEDPVYYIGYLDTEYFALFGPFLLKRFKQNPMIAGMYAMQEFPSDLTKLSTDLRTLFETVCAIGRLLSALEVHWGPLERGSSAL